MAEFAVLVRSDLQGRGVGWVLMTRLIDYAAAAGVAEIAGDVMVGNADMLTLMHDLCFAVAVHPDDVTLRRVRLAPVRMPNTAKTR